MGTRTMFDAFKSAAGFTEDVLAYNDQLNRQQAAVELNTLAIEKEQGVNKLMLELQQRGDYQNYEKLTDEFLTKFDKDAESRLSSPYAKKQYGMSAAANRVDVLNTVQKQALQLQKEDILVKDAELRQLITNTYGNTDEAVQKKNENYAGEFASNIIDEQTYRTSCLKAGQDAYTNQLFDFSQKRIAELAEQGVPLDEIYGIISAEINAKECDIQVRVLDTSTANMQQLEDSTAKYQDISHLLNTEASKTAANQRLNEIINTEIKETQRQNFSSGVDFYLRSRDDSLSPAKRLEILKEGKAFAVGCTGYALDSDKKKQLVDMFDREIEELSKPKDSTGASGKKPAFTAAILESAMPRFIVGIFNGEISPQEALESVKEYTMDNILPKYGYDTSDPAKRDAMFDQAQVDAGTGFITSFYKKVNAAFSGSPQMKGVLDTCEKRAKEILESDTYKSFAKKHPEEAAAFISGYNGYAMQLIYESKAGTNFDSKAFYEQLTKYETSCLSKVLTEKSKVSEVEFSDGTIGQGLNFYGDKDEDTAAVMNAWNEATVHKDEYGNVRFQAGQKELYNEVSNVGISWISAECGIDMNKITPLMNETSTDIDIASEKGMRFAADGRTFYMQPDGKNKLVLYEEKDGKLEKCPARGIEAKKRYEELKQNRREAEKKVFTRNVNNGSKEVAATVDAHKENEEVTQAIKDYKISEEAAAQAIDNAKEEAGQKGFAEGSEEYKKLIDEYLADAVENSQ